MTVGVHVNKTTIALNVDCLAGRERGLGDKPHPDKQTKADLEQSDDQKPNRISLNGLNT